MTMELLSVSLETAGTLMIAWAALRVHHRVLNEHKITKKVFRIMRLEQRTGVLGTLFVIAGYLLHIAAL